MRPPRPSRRTLRLSAALGKQSAEGMRVGTKIPPRQARGIHCKIVLAFALARAKRAHALQIAHHLRLRIEDARRIKLELLQPLRQQCGGIGPLAGENAEIGSTHSDVVGETLSVAVFKSRKFASRPAPAFPITPVPGEPAGCRLLLLSCSR